MSREPETGNMRLKNDTRERFRENVCSIFDSRSVRDNDRARFNVRANEMVTNVNVLGLAMVGVVDGEGLGPIVVDGENER